ncbi:hypothetical protein Aperf_G00000104447 [Anoplocephala perfoliata]
MTSLRRSKSAPRLTCWSILEKVTARKAFRPWSPINPPFNRFTYTKDIDIFETLTMEDLNQFQSAIEDNNLVDYSTFTDILKGLSVKANDWQLRRLFDKINVKASGSINWDDICAFIMQSEHLKDKEKLPTHKKNFQCRVQPLVHKNPITRIEVAQNFTDLVVGDNVNPHHLQQGQQQPGRQKWYTDFLFMHDVGKIVVSTGCFFQTLNVRRKMPDTNQHTLIWGDSNGNISILQFTDFADLLRHWRSLQQMDAPPTLSISSAVMDPKISFIRWKTHEEWVAKIWDLDNQICQATVVTKACAKIHGDLQSCTYSPTTHSLLLITDEACLVQFEPNWLMEEQKWKLNHQSWEYFGGCIFGNSSQARASAETNLNLCDRLLWETVHTHKVAVSLCKYNATFNHLITAAVDSVFAFLWERLAIIRSNICVCKSIRVWNFATAQLVSEIADAHHGEPITSMCFDLTDRRLITGGRDGFVKIWNHNSGACLMELKPSTYIAVVGWNPRITLYLDDPETFWSESNHELEQLFLPPWRHDEEDVAIGHQEDICEMAVSHSSDLLATADFSGEICVWNAASSHVLKRLGQNESRKGENISGLLFLESREQCRNAACLVSCGPFDVIHFWSIYATEPKFASFQPSSVKNVIPTRISLGQVFEDGKSVDAYLFTGDEIGGICVWNIRSYALAGPETNRPKSCFIGTFGQPMQWDIAHATSMASGQMGPFDVLVDPQTHNVPEYQNIQVETSQIGVSLPSLGRWGDPNFERYTKELFGELSSNGKEINNVIEEVIHNPASLFSEAKIKAIDKSTSVKTGLSVKESHPRIFHQLSIYQLDPEALFEKPKKYTDPELMMEDIEAANLDEEMPQMKQSFEQRSDPKMHSINAFSKMNAFRKRGQLCDVVVKVGGRVFPAHRVVLAASSDYFGAMFSNGMAESEQLEIELKSVSADVMEALLDFVYTGQVKVSMDNVQELLPAASLVQMEGVKSVCSAFLFGQIEASNVLGIRRFAELHSCTDLEVFAKNYAAHNFETVFEFEEFLLMNAEELIELLSREDLHIDSEETAYNAVIRWVYYDELNRAVHLPNLLNYVRLAIMSVRFLTDVVDNERLIRQSLECRDLVDEAKRFHLRPDLRSQMRQRRFHQRDCGDEYLVVIGGFGSYQSPSDSVEMFNPRTREWSELPNLPISYRYVAACSLGTCVYVIGGFDGGERLNTVGLLDVAQREDGWRWLAPMHYKRGLSAACTHKGLIYVCGGFDGQTRLRALEVYHPKIDEWRVLEEMTTAREGAGLVVADDTLFCLGGYDGFQLLNSMEAFDLRRGTWSQCKPMYMRRSGAGCAVIVDTLYVCGGYGGPEGRSPLHLDTVEAYNTRLAQWTLVANMNVPRCYVGACQLAGRVYVAAGYNGNRLLNTVEAFDPIDNTWTLYEESRMHNERCDTGMCVVRFLSCAMPSATPTVNYGGAGTSNSSQSNRSIAQRVSRGSTTTSTSTIDGSTSNANNTPAQVVQIVTPLLQGHGVVRTTPPQSQAPHPHLLVHQSLLRQQQNQNRGRIQHQSLPESTGAPPIPGQRVMPIREPILTTAQTDAEEDAEVEVEAEEEEEEEAFWVDEAGVVEIEAELSERNDQIVGDLLTAELESVAAQGEDASILPADGSGVADGRPLTPGVDATYQHPDGAAADDTSGGSIGLMFLRPTLAEMDGEQLARDGDNEDDDREGSDDREVESDEGPISPSLPQSLTTTPLGLGLILEGMNVDLQHRMAFLRGRESSGSQDDLTSSISIEEAEEENGTLGAILDGETDPQLTGRPPSPSRAPSDSLLWLHRPSPTSGASPTNHNVRSLSGSQSGDGLEVGGGVGAENSRSDGEGEEGESEIILAMVSTSTPGVGEPSAVPEISPSSVNSPPIPRVE